MIEQRVMGRFGLPARTILTSIGLLAAAGAASAQGGALQVQGGVHCSASFVETDQGLRWESSYDQATQAVPCPGILVSAFVDVFGTFDHHCGSAFTDATGRFSIPTTCGGMSGPLNRGIFVRVDAVDLRGDSVGVHGGTFDDPIEEAILAIFTGGLSLLVDTIADLVDHDTFSWVSAPTDPGNRTAIDLGVMRLAGGGHLERVVDRTFTISQFTLAKLPQTTADQMMPFRYTINHPIGFPTTIWDTVIVSDARMRDDTARMLRATSHELGHVLYNSVHVPGAPEHWFLDAVPEYTQNHALCQAINEPLGWYEGFAHLIRDVTTAGTVNSDGTPTRPNRGCAEAGQRTGMIREGNVLAMLNEMYFGPEIDCPLRDEHACPGNLPLIARFADNACRREHVCENELPTRCQRFFDRTSTRHDDRNGLADACSHCTRTIPRSCTDAPVVCDGATPVGGAATPTAARLVAQPGPDRCRIEIAAMRQSPALPSGYVTRPDGSVPAALAMTSQPTRDWFGLLTLDQIVGLIASAGPTAHTAVDFQPTIMALCEGTRDAAMQPWYCDRTASPEYRRRIFFLDSAF